jgi:hypothetical protein
MLILYDLVPRVGGPYFSPASTRARLALLHKGIPFRTIDLTYKQLRLDGWGAKAGCDEDGVATGMSSLALTCLPKSDVLRGSAVHSEGRRVVHPRLARHHAVQKHCASY